MELDAYTIKTVIALGILWFVFILLLLCAMLYKINKAIGELYNVIRGYICFIFILGALWSVTMTVFFGFLLAIQ
jgi:hypothetical protein